MTAKPDIAVLLPCYNPGHGLIATLDSLRQQTVPYHLYLVDDGSKKKPDYEEALTGILHTLIELPQNVGITRALNAGLEQLLKDDFKFIARIDSGDVMISERLALQRAYLESHPDIDIVGGWVDLHYTETNRRVALSWPVEHADIARGLWLSMCLSHPLLMLRANVFRNLGPYSEDFEAAEDYELCRRALRHGMRFHNIPKVLLVKIETRDSISWQKRRRQLQSRLKAQWTYRDLSVPACLAGLAKTSITLALPGSLVNRMKGVAEPG